MSNQITTFSFVTSSISTLIDDKNNPWFVAKDICSALELDNVSQACSRLDEDEKLVSSLMIAGQNREVLLINESGLYSLVLSSNKPQAKAFKKWITSEVLPTLRKQGFYGKVEPKHFLAVTKRIAELSKAISDSDKPFLTKTLLEQLKTFHMMAGTSMPDLRLLGDSMAQIDWTESDKGGAK